MKPKYVDMAAQAVMSKNSGSTVKIDLQKVSDDVYYTKLLLTLQGGDVPDVFHFVWSSLPAGTYTVFLALTAPGSLADGTINSADIIVIATDTVTLSP